MNSFKLLNEFQQNLLFNHMEYYIFQKTLMLSKLFTIYSQLKNMVVFKLNNQLNLSGSI